MKDVLALLAVCCLLQTCVGENQEKRLLQALFSHYGDYDLIARPVEDQNQTLLVKLGLTVVDIVEVEGNSLNVVGWLSQSWVDTNLQWNPEDYGGVQVLSFPHRMSWTPDIKLFNRVNLNEDIFHKEMKVVSSDGTVMWVPRDRLQIKCKRVKKNMKELSCKFNFGSWVYNQKQLDLAFLGKKDIDMSSFQPDPRWDVVATSAVRESKRFPGVPDSYVSVHFKMVLEPREKKHKQERINDVPKQHRSINV